MRLKSLSAGLLLITLLQGCISSQEVTRTTDENEAAGYNLTLGANYYSQGKLDLAREKLEHAIQQDPSRADAFSILALVYWKLDDARLAEKHYRQAIKLSPDDPSVQNAFAVFLRDRLNEYEEAERYFLTAARNARYPTPEAAFTNAGVCAKNIPDLPRAEQFLRAALDKNPVYPSALLQFADVALARDNHLQARAFLERYLAAGESNAEALWLGVRIEEAMGDQRAVARFASQLKDDFPDSIQTRLLLESKRNAQ